MLRDLADWYPQLGDWLKKNFSGWEAWIISGDPLLPKLLGLKASRRIPLFNGQIETRFLQYKIVAGSRCLDKAISPVSSRSDDIQMIKPRHHVAAFGFLAVQLDLQAQVVEAVGVAQRVLVGDHAGFVEIEQRLVEGLHAELA